MPFVRTFQHLYYVFTTFEWGAPSPPNDLRRTAGGTRQNIYVFVTVAVFVRFLTRFVRLRLSWSIDHLMKKTFALCHISRRHLAHHLDCVALVLDHLTCGKRAARRAIARLDELARLHAFPELRFNLSNRGVTH